MHDLSLVMTVYEPYQPLLARTLPALDRHWPGHPTPIMANGDSRLQVRMLEGVQRVETPFVIVLHEDYRLCRPVKVDQLDECLTLMRSDPCVLSCSLTFEPIAKKRFKRTKFQELPAKRSDWPYAIGFQARIWRVPDLLRILRELPRNVPHGRFEPRCTDYFRRRLFPRMRVVSYPVPAPPKINPFVDRMDKSHWIIAYDNLIHGGRVMHIY